MNVQALTKSPKDKTLLIQGSTNETNISVPKMICWKDINLLDDWVTVNENYSQNQQASTSHDIQNIQQFNDGSVHIRFNRPSSQSSRHSTSSLPTETDEDEIFNTPLFTRKDRKLHICEPFSQTQHIHSKLKGIDNSSTSQISKPVYSAHTHLQEEDTISQDSPTQTDVEEVPPVNTKLLTLSKSFTLDLNKLHAELISIAN